MTVTKKGGVNMVQFFLDRGATADSAGASVNIIVQDQEG